MRKEFLKEEFLTYRTVVRAERDCIWWDRGIEHGAVVRLLRPHSEQWAAEASGLGRYVYERVIQRIPQERILFMAQLNSTCSQGMVW